MNQAKWMPIAGIFLGVNILAVIGTSVRHFASAKSPSPIAAQDAEPRENPNTEQAKVGPIPDKDGVQLHSDPSALHAQVANERVAEAEVTVEQPRVTTPSSPLDSLEIPPAGPASDLENEPFFQEFMEHFSDPELGFAPAKKSASQDASVNRSAIERSLACASSTQHVAIAIQSLLTQADRDLEAGDAKSAAELFGLVRKLQKISGELISR